jgi:hypothetical protein
MIDPSRAEEVHIEGRYTRMLLIAGAMHGSASMNARQCVQTDQPMSTKPKWECLSPMGVGQGNPQ